jgi:ribosome-associated translation inhibitor RaiA
MDHLTQEPTVSVVFSGMVPSDSIRAYATAELGCLVGSDDEVRACRFVIEAHEHAHVAQRYRAVIELSIGRTTLLVGSRTEAFTDLHAAIDAAVGDARRVLHQRRARQHHLAH